MKNGNLKTNTTSHGDTSWPGRGSFQEFKNLV